MEFLRNLTMARVGLGRAGVSLPTREVLAFQAAHARARDAVHCALDVAGLRREFALRGWSSVALRSQARDRSTFLRRPDFGRRLSAESAALTVPGSAELAILIADGLSAMAVHRHAAPLLAELLPLCGEWRTGPLYLIEQGRVALSDDLGAAVGAEMALMLIGERPGLSSPDSLGAYLTFRPRPGRTDAERNCLSNIHGGGIGYGEAAERLRRLMGEARRLGGTGVMLKERGALSAVTEVTQFTVSAPNVD